MTKSAGNCGFGHIYWKIFHGNLHFLCRAIILDWYYLCMLLPWGIQLRECLLRNETFRTGAKSVWVVHYKKNNFHDRSFNFTVYQSYLSLDNKFSLRISTKAFTNSCFLRTRFINCFHNFTRSFRRNTVCRSVEAVRFILPPAVIFS